MVNNKLARDIIAAIPDGTDMGTVADTFGAVLGALGIGLVWSEETLREAIQCTYLAAREVLNGTTDIN